MGFLEFFTKPLSFQSYVLSDGLSLSIYTSFSPNINLVPPELRIWVLIFSLDGETEITRMQRKMNIAYVVYTVKIVIYPMLDIE